MNLDNISQDTHSDRNFDEIPWKVCTIPCMYAGVDLGGAGAGGVTGVGTPPNIKSMTSPLKIDISTKIETVLIAV